MMKPGKMKAQGSLEYLILIVAVLFIVGMVIYFLGSAAGGQSGDVTLCKQAATTCKSTRLLSPDDPCNHCETACSDVAGLDLMTRQPVTPGYNVQGSAVYLCRLGEPGMIYEVTGTCDTACTLCGDETDCTGSSASCSWCGTACADTCYCSDGTEYKYCSSVTQSQYCTDTGQLIYSCGPPGNCLCPTGTTCQADGTCAVPPQTCPGGTTAYGDCVSGDPPKYCDPTTGTIVIDCNECGCPSGYYDCESDGTCTPKTCPGGTAYDACVLADPPKYCDPTTGTIVIDCNECPCPSGYACETSTGKCKLADGEQCSLHIDCLGGWCGGAVLGSGPNLCWDLDTACGDSQVTLQTGQQIETDVDCGGKCADERSQKCGAEKKCLKGTDCTSGSCTSDGITLGECFGTYYFQDNFNDADISDWTEEEGPSGTVEVTGPPPTTYVTSGRALKIVMPSVSSSDSALAKSKKWSQDTSDHIVTFKFLLAGWMTPKYADTATNDYLPLYSDAKGQIFVTDTGDTNDWEVSCFEDMTGLKEIFEVDEDIWYTVKLTHDGQGDYTIYLDGTQKATCSDTPFPFVDTTGNDCGGVNCHNYMQIGPNSYVDIFGELLVDDIKIYH